MLLGIYDIYVPLVSHQSRRMSRRGSYTRLIYIELIYIGLFVIYKLYTGKVPSL